MCKKRFSQNDLKTCFAGNIDIYADMGKKRLLKVLKNVFLLEMLIFLDMWVKNDIFKVILK